MFDLIILIIIAYFAFRVYKRYKTQKTEEQVNDYRSIEPVQSAMETFSVKKEAMPQTAASPVKEKVPLQTTASSSENQIPREKTRVEEIMDGWTYEQKEQFIREARNDASEGDITALKNMIIFYQDGVEGFIEPNPEEVKCYVKEAADAGSADMAYNYAFIIGANDPEAEKYMCLAADGGHTEAKYYAYLMLRSSSDKNKVVLSMAYLSSACKDDYPDAVKELCDVLKASGKSEAEIQQYVDKFKNATINQCGEENTPEDYRNTVENLIGKARKGDVQSMIWLGDMYYQGKCGIPKSELAVLKYWKMAADHGDTEMAFKTGLIYLRLKNTDQEQALHYIRIAADAGNADAMFTSYVMLSGGLGCEANPELAYKYLQAAAQAGQKDAVAEMAKK